MHILIIEYYVHKHKIRGENKWDIETDEDAEVLVTGPEEDHSAISHHGNDLDTYTDEAPACT